MQASLLVCDYGEYLEAEKRYKLGNVINFIEIPTVPYIVNLFVFIKLSYISSTEQYKIYVELYTKNKKLVFRSDLSLIYNRRNSDSIAGVDTSLFINTSIYTKGIHTFKLYVDDEIVAQYPFNVHIKK
ncbi:MAG: hypothetical protein AB9856_13890 [Cellulosilyticaceae bacterium]